MLSSTEYSTTRVLYYTLLAAKRIQNALARRVYPVLRASPREVPSAARLKDWDPPTWRIRIGTWRLFFEIDDEKRIVFLTAADHRKDAYR